jgi:hypothetical protein
VLLVGIIVISAAGASEDEEDARDIKKVCVQITCASGKHNSDIHRESKARRKMLWI